MKSLQRALNALGYDAGTANGYYSSTVTAAVKAFQSKAGLTATGEANEDTIGELVTKVSAKISDNDTVMKAALTKVEGMQ
ncbi:peptidoglycan-binding domain-containing protein [Lacticaseibacillus pantheris]|uniref:peptidoglycan-binding domain-containing protein n=1 Tax=Lacticaseibacillus pantheris TaxID=171523 RepID=UPI000AE8D048|nr:peptidoglycan-binding domain-containing protein [Lacticaseibacillus pantheris]